MHRVLKYQLKNPGDITSLDLPVDWEPVLFARQGEHLCLWAAVPLESEDEETVTEDFAFQIMATGQPFDAEVWNSVTSTLDGPFVWHLYWARGREVKKAEDDLPF